jgi:putative transcriptional regulator
MNMSNTVQKARLARGITQEELAENVGVTRQTIIAIEKGNYSPSVFLALRIAKVLGKRAEDLFDISL